MTNKSLTVALISAFPPGTQSLNEYGYHLALSLAQNPDVERVVILADELGAPQAELDLSPKIEVQRVWRFNALSSMPRILRALRKIRPDLALYNVQIASFGDREIPAALGLMTPMISRMTGIYSGIISHNMASGINLEDTVLKGKPIRQRIIKLGTSIIDWTMMHANYITFTLSSYSDYYKARFPRARIFHVPHGTFDTTKRDLRPNDERAPLLVTMGKFGTYKRLETLITAMDILRANKEFSNLKLIIGGTDHPNKQGYMKSVEAECAGRDDIEFWGYVAEDDIPEFFSQAKISVFDYSSTTGSSGVLHQTASYGAVPIFPAIGDFVEACKDEGLVGVNYQPNVAIEMARAIEWVFQNPKEANQIAEQNRRAADELPIDQIVSFHISQINEPT